jgi:oligoribonuclease NrnB/cAMP/cGMP phosphodiesterase (DHH superfamily)
MHAVLCSAQLDGIAAAAILFRAARLRGAETRLAGLLTHDNALQVFREASQHQKQLFFVLDFLPDNLPAFVPVLEKLVRQNRIAYWNSHHPYDGPSAELLRRFAHTVDLSGPVHYGAVPTERLCAAELAQRRFLPQDAIAQTLAALAHDIEFWERRDERAIKLADLIASGFDAKELAEILSRGVFWSSRFDRLREDYLARRAKALQELMQHAVIRKYVTTTFAFTLAPSLLPTADAGQHVLDSHAGVDVSVVLYRNGRISFRKRDTCALDLAELARLFGGGGHAYAAGARLDLQVTRDTFERALFLIDRALKDHFLR